MQHALNLIIDIDLSILISQKLLIQCVGLRSPPGILHFTSAIVVLKTLIILPREGTLLFYIDHITD